MKAQHVSVCHRGGFCAYFACLCMYIYARHQRVHMGAKQKVKELLAALAASALL